MQEISVLRRRTFVMDSMVRFFERVCRNCKMDTSLVLLSVLLLSVLLLSVLSLASRPSMLISSIDVNP